MRSVTQVGSGWVNIGCVIMRGAGEGEQLCYLVFTKKNGTKNDEPNSDLEIYEIRYIALGQRLGSIF